MTMTVGWIFFCFPARDWKATRLKVTVENDATAMRSDVYLQGLSTFVRLPKLAKALDSIPGEYAVHLHTGRTYHIDHVCMDMIDSAVAQRSARGGKMEVHWEELQRLYHLRDVLEG